MNRAETSDCPYSSGQTSARITPSDVSRRRIPLACPSLTSTPAGPTVIPSSPGGDKPFVLSLSKHLEGWRGISAPRQHQPSARPNHFPFSFAFQFRPSLQRPNVRPHHVIVRLPAPHQLRLPVLHKHNRRPQRQVVVASHLQHVPPRLRHRHEISPVQLLHR